MFRLIRDCWARHVYRDRLSKTSKITKPHSSLLRPGCVMGAVPLAVMLTTGTARATYIVNLVESGGNVVATGSGSLDVTGLSGGVAGNAVAKIQADIAGILIGPTTSSVLDIYRGITGPTSFGSGVLQFNANSGSGDLVGIVGVGGLLAVRSGYLSGNPLSDTSTWDSQTFASLGLTPGTYTWTWGSGADADSFILNIGVPEPATWSLFGMGVGALGLLGWRRKKKAAALAA